MFLLWLRLWPFCLIFQKCLSFVCKLLVLCLRTACLVYVNCLSYFSEHSVYLLNLLVLYICERVCLMSVNVLSCVCWSLYWTRSKHIKDSKERYLLGQKKPATQRVIPFIKLQNNTETKVKRSKRIEKWITWFFRFGSSLFKKAVVCGHSCDFVLHSKIN